MRVSKTLDESSILSRPASGIIVYGWFYTVCQREPRRAQEGNLADARRSAVLHSGGSGRYFRDFGVPLLPR